MNYEKITRDTSPDVICTIFETINTTGVKLTVFDLLVAKCFKADIRLRDKLEEALEQFHWIQRLDPEGELVATIQLPRIISLFHNGQCRKGDILRLRPDIIAEKWDQAVAALNRALKIVHDRFGGISVDYIPSMDAIAPLAVLCADHRFNLDAHSAKLARWYWCVAFSQYLSGAPESKIARVLREWLREGGWLVSDEGEPESVKNFVFRKSQLDDATKQSAIYKGVLALVMSRDPQDIGNERVRLGELPASEVHDHHIFPQRYLHSHRVKGAKANGILNRMPMSAATNLKIGNVAPRNYLNDASIVGEAVSQRILDDYGIARELTDIDFTVDNYELFL